MSFNERITELSELEAKASHANWEIGLASKFICSRDKDTGIFHSVGDINTIDDLRLVCALRNKTLPLLREMQDRIADLEDDYLYASSQDQMSLAENKQLQAENERLRQGIKDVAEKCAEMYDLRDHFYYEMENAQTALLFANRENERLRAGIGKAVEYLQHQFGYDDVLALEQEFRQISFGDVTEFMDFMKELGALQNDA